MEMRCYRSILHISCQIHITNQVVCNEMDAVVCPYEELLSTGNKDITIGWALVNIKWPLQKYIQDTVAWQRKTGRQNN